MKSRIRRLKRTIAALRPASLDDAIEAVIARLDPFLQETVRYLRSSLDQEPQPDADSGDDLQIHPPSPVEPPFPQTPPANPGHP